jgi:hypothetical protein
MGPPPFCYINRIGFPVRADSYSARISATFARLSSRLDPIAAIFGLVEPRIQFLCLFLRDHFRKGSGQMNTLLQLGLTWENLNQYVFVCIRAVFRPFEDPPGEGAEGGRLPDPLPFQGATGRVAFWIR